MDTLGLYLALVAAVFTGGRHAFRYIYASSAMDGAPLTFWSAATTIAIAGVYAWIRPPVGGLPAGGVFIGCALGAVYCIYSLLSIYSQRDLSYATHHSIVRLGHLGPVLIFFWLYGEEPRIEEWTVIVVAILAITGISFLPGKSTASVDRRFGLLAVCGTVLASTAIVLLTRRSVVDSDAAIDKTATVVLSNMVILLISFGLVRGNVLGRSGRLRQPMLVAGAIDGSLNFLIFYLVLSAYETGAEHGHSSMIATIVASAVLIGSALVDAVEDWGRGSGERGKRRARSIANLVVLLLWALGVVWVIQLQ